MSFYACFSSSSVTLKPHKDSFIVDSFFHSFCRYFTLKRMFFEMAAEYIMEPAYLPIMKLSHMKKQ